MNLQSVNRIVVLMLVLMMMVWWWMIVTSSLKDLQAMGKHSLV